MTNLFNHLWQSTVFAAAAWVLTLALRKNRASLRYGIWFAASCKFLIPFSLLVALGNQFEWRTAPATLPPQITLAIDQVVQPFPATAEVRYAKNAEFPSRTPSILFGVWLCGFAAGIFSWCRQWQRARAAVRASAPRGNVAGVSVMSSPSRVEPGIFGIFRPVLLLPKGIEKRLTAGQIRAILAHELCHVRRRDNLTAAIHMLMETIFWFHPAAWMIRAKLTEERERACDEAVLRESVEPEVYAEGILNVCKYFLESRLVCVSGVTGSNLKKRIEAIMLDRVTGKLNFAKRLLLAGATVAAIAGPIVIGFLNAPAIRAQSQPLSFEVASVKPGSPGENRSGYNFESARFKAENLPLYALVAIAYDLPLRRSERITGGPNWVGSEGFDVEGKTDMPVGLSAKAREVRMKRMLQTLLADRFKLELRRETKEMPIYALSVGKNGPKLKNAKAQEKDCPEGRANAESCHVINGGMGRGLHGKAVDIADVVQFAGYWTDRPLIDKTGLQGLYEIDTEGWAPMVPRPPRPDGQPNAEDIAMADPARPTLGMIFDRLGLKMEAQKGPVEMFIIERAEKPTAN